MTKAEKRKEWEARIARYRASGQSVREWCAANNVKPERLWYWLRKDKTKTDTPLEQPIQWLPVEISETSSGDQPILLRTGKISIEVKPGFDPETLGQVLCILTTIVC